MATIDGRDYSVVQLVARFKQVTAKQVHELLFSQVSTPKPCQRSLQRLMQRGFLTRIEHRIVGGAKGGSGQYVYMLAPTGHYLMSEGPYRRRTTIDYHALAIVDTYSELVRLERVRRLVITGFSTEPDCWQVVGGQELKPDLFVDIERPAGKLQAWCEIDMGTEGDKQIKGKLARYVRAYNSVDADAFPEWPLTIWVTVDAWRFRQLSWLIGQLPADQQALFRVCERQDLPGLVVPTVDV